MTVYPNLQKSECTSSLISSLFYQLLKATEMLWTVSQTGLHIYIIISVHDWLFKLRIRSSGELVDTLCGVSPVSPKWTPAWTRLLAVVHHVGKCGRCAQLRPLLTGTSLSPEATSFCQRGVAFGLEPSYVPPRFSAHWWRGQLRWWQPSWRTEALGMRRWSRSQGQALAPCSQGHCSSPWGQGCGRSSEEERKGFVGGVHQQPALQLAAWSHRRKRGTRISENSPLKSGRRTRIIKQQNAKMLQKIFYVI